jgi:hypothetical protein
MAYVIAQESDVGRFRLNNKLEGTYNMACAWDVQELHLPTSRPHEHNIRRSNRDVNNF